MPVVHRQGDLFSTELTHIGHGVNTHGKMGKGIAVQFRRRFPDMFDDYKDACVNAERDDRLVPGGVHHYHSSETDIHVYNIASQDRPGPHARLEWLRSGLGAALGIVAHYGGEGIAIPRIGCGIGGLEWGTVLPVLEALANDHSMVIEIWAM